MYRSLFTLAAAAALLGAQHSVSAAPSSSAPTKSATLKGKKSFIQLIGDGFGPASETFARSYLQARDGLPWNTTLALDGHLVGTVRTRSTDSLVTDSAASATAYSCGVKSVNAYIGVDVDAKPCGTVLEAAKAAGYHTALVTTSRVTHATPASYSAHISDRDLENDIAAQQLGNYGLGRQVDILWGGGRRHFLPKSDAESSREDDRDLIAEAQKDGWHVLTNRSAFEAYLGKAKKSGSGSGSDGPPALPSLGLFTDSHMAYEVDRNATAEPSLKEMALAALDTLKAAGEPFFIMIEGARIDHAAHNNDPVGHVHDILQFNEVFDAVAKWVDDNDEAGETDADEDPQYLMLSTADHECGGLTLALQRDEDDEGAYLWYPDVLFSAKHSTEFLAGEFIKWAAAAAADADKVAYMRDGIIKGELGVQDVEDDEVQRAVDLAAVDDEGVSLAIWLASILNWRAHLGWSTTGHSGVDVNLYLHTKRPSAKMLATMAGNHENEWLGQFTARYLGVDTAAVTKKLNGGSDVPAGAGAANKTTLIDKYHGGVKRVVPAAKAAAASASKKKRDHGHDHAQKKRSFEVGYSHAENDAIRRRWM